MPSEVVGHAREIVAIADVEEMLARGEVSAFTEGERRYAGAKSDPPRRLAARWAAKQAAAAVLGGGVPLSEIEIVRGQGAPRLRLHGQAALRHRALGGGPLHVSLTHGLAHAAASVVLEAGAR